jgi:hypothetical protein
MRAYDDFEWTSAAELEQLASGEIPWQHYLEAAVHFESPKLSGTVLPTVDDGGKLPPRGPLHVIAVVQPDSDPDDDGDKARIDVLDRDLLAAGISFIPAVGSSFDGSHSEESRAIFGLDDDQARPLGQRFGQVAVFAWRGRWWSLLACASDRRTHSSWRWEPDAW